MTTHHWGTRRAAEVRSPIEATWRTAHGAVGVAHGTTHDICCGKIGTTNASIARICFHLQEAHAGESAISVN